MYALAERVPTCRRAARRLGLISLAQMTRALVWTVEHAPRGVRVLEVPALRQVARRVHQGGARAAAFLTSGMLIPGLAFDPDARGLDWRPTRERGVSWIPLHLEAASGGHKAAGEPADATVLIRMDPGCGYPTHRHVGIEEVLVLSGGYQDELGTWRAGAYVRYPSGSRHTPVALGDAQRPSGPDNPACVLFACARGGVELQDA